MGRRKSRSVSMSSFSSRTDSITVEVFAVLAVLSELVMFATKKEVAVIYVFT